MNNKVAYNQILGYTDTDLLFPVAARSKPCGLSHTGIAGSNHAGECVSVFVNVVYCHIEFSA